MVNMVCAAACCLLALFGPAITAAAHRSAAADEQSLLKLEKDWAEAEKRHDVAALRDILDDRFVATLGTGNLLDKQAFIEAVTSGPVDPGEREQLSDSTVIVAGDTAVVVQTETGHVGRNGLPTDVVARLTVTYTRIKGRWKALAVHAALKPPD